MIIQDLNWLAVVVSALAYFALGAIWFNPKVFGTIWMKGNNITPNDEDKKRMPMVMLTTLVFCFIGPIAMGYFVNVFNFYQENWQWYSGVKVGLVAGIGFTGVGIAMNYMYTRKYRGRLLSLIHPITLLEWSWRGSSCPFGDNQNV